MSEAEQTAETRRLLDARAKGANPFTVLQLDVAHCSIADVNKSFRRIALLLHPDKCTLPHATDAFHVAERAHKLLSQDAVLDQLKHAHQKRVERNDAARQSAPNTSPRCGQRTAKVEGTSSGADITPFGHLSHLASNGLSTDAQKADEIRRLLRCRPTDYFAILDLDPGVCQVSDVDRRYRKMAQALHPDKCHLPHVTEAFNVFERAHKELADERKLVRFKVSFQQQQRRTCQAASEARTSLPATQDVTCRSEDGLSAEARLELRRREALREQQLQSLRLAEEATRKRRRVEKETIERAELAAELERQRQEWRDLQLF